MVNDLAVTSKILFEVIDVFGKKVRTTQRYWIKIIETKHTDLLYGTDEVISVLTHPEEVYRSVTHSTISIFKKKMQDKYTLMVLVKHLNGEGFLVTVYQTTKSYKKGEKLWPK